VLKVLTAHNKRGQHAAQRTGPANPADELRQRLIVAAGGEQPAGGLVPRAPWVIPPRPRNFYDTAITGRGRGPVNPGINRVWP